MAVFVMTGTVQGNPRGPQIKTFEGPFTTAALGLPPELPYRDLRLAAPSRRTVLSLMAAVVTAARAKAQTPADIDYDPKKMLDRLMVRTGGAQALRLRYPEFDQAVFLLVPPDDHALRNLAKAFILYLMVKNNGIYGLNISKDAHEAEDYFMDKVLQTAGGRFRLAYKMAAGPSSRKSLERSIYQAISRDLRDPQSVGHRILGVRRAQQPDSPLEISRVAADVLLSALLRYFGLTGSVWNETDKDWTVDDEFLTTDLGPLHHVVTMTGVAPFRLNFSDPAGFCVGVIPSATIAAIKAIPLDKAEFLTHLPKSRGKGGMGAIVNKLGAPSLINSLQSLRTFTGLGPVLAPYWLRAEDENRIASEIQSQPKPGRAGVERRNLVGLARAA